MSKDIDNKKLRVFEAFAGIGSQRKALEKVMPNDYEIVGMAEWYVPAIIMYQAIHNNFSLEKINKSIERTKMEEYLESKPLSWDSKSPVSKGYWKRKHLNDLRIVYHAVKMSEKEGNVFDVRTLFKRTLSDVDLLTYSFPCQDLSQQGIQKGMKKGSGTRSGLLWEIEKALDATPKNKLPKYLLMENVAALMHKINATELNEWMMKLESLGYKNSIGILNAGDFGSAQARRRAFMISSRDEKIELPIGGKNPKNLNFILEKEFDEKYLMPALDKYDLIDLMTTKSNIKKSYLKDYSSFNSEAFVYDPNFTGPTLTATGANSRIKIRYNNKIRRMNPLEAFRYMGFENKDFGKIEKLNFITENQKIFVCGNSISVEVLKAIMERFQK